MRPRQLLQVCNVGSVTGGTAVCAWSVTRSLPDWEHRVACLGRVPGEMRRVFHPVEVVEVSRVTHTLTSGCSLAIFHNTAAQRVETMAIPTIGYRHSKIDLANTTLELDCSYWLAGSPDAQRVLWQGAARPLPCEVDGRPLRDNLTIGRLCTPRQAKWPECETSLFAKAAEEFPRTRFEFVGCPEQLRESYQRAVGGRARFLPASWQARNRLAEWDVLLYSNRAVTESFGRIVCESALVGCIPIVDRRGGFIEQLADGGGFLCENEADFLNALKTVHDPYERRRVSREAMAIARERFSLLAFRTRLLERFEETRNLFES